MAPFNVAICTSLLLIYLISWNCFRRVLFDQGFFIMTGDCFRPMDGLFRPMQLPVLHLSPTTSVSPSSVPICTSPVPSCDMSTGISSRPFTA
jgi:hypothetical protein